jgi:hypothetical protein
MSITPSVYAKARSEILGLFGWNADSLSPDQTLRIDCAVALRLALDDLQGRIVRGESADVSRMLTASEALARLLPPAVLASPPAEEHGDPRQVMLKIYMEMRKRGEVPPEGWHQHRINQLELENTALKAQLVAGGLTPALPDVADRQVDTSVHLKTAITPALADIALPGEHGVKPRVGIERGPDDPKPRSTTVIEGKANPPAASAPARPAWEDWLAAGGYSSPGYDRWSNRNGA